MDGKTSHVVARQLLLLLLVVIVVVNLVIPQSHLRVRMLLSHRVRLPISRAR